jgi:signal transduction histidine kinase
VQEAVNNAFRHSGATEIAVQIAASGSRATIRVQDDGKGLTSHLRRHASGIANMRTRAALIDARFKLKSGPKGTEIWLEIDGSAHVPQTESETI